MKLAAIIQARSNSNRLKDKMSLELSHNKKIFEWVLIRAIRSKKIKNFILATTNNKRDEILIKIAKKYNLKIFKGKENDVLNRFYECSKKFKIDTIVRICADNPLIDSDELDKLVNYFSKHKPDYAYNTMKTKDNFNSDGFGAEILNFKTLKETNFLAKKKKEREHVTQFIRNNKNLFKTECLNPSNGLNFPYLKFDVNTSSNLKKIKNVISKQKVNFKTSAKKIVKTLLTSEIDLYLKKLFPLNRSLTGEGNIKTLKEINNITKIKIKKIQSGKKVYDWTVPKEWIVKEAWIKDLHSKKKIIDFKKNNLSLINYSNSFYGKLLGSQLKQKLHYHNKLKNAIPYKTTYFKKDWGFCVNKEIYKKIIGSKKKFEINIKTKFKNGNLVYGEKILKGKSKKEILISTYICHPSMANDNLSGVILTSFLAKFLSSIKNRKWTYRILFVPETIGAIAYLKKNEKLMKKINFGLVISNVGGKGKFSCKESFDKTHFLNKLVKDSIHEQGYKPTVYPFDINGSDERQYSSQFFKINICSIFKDKYYDFKEYHSSADNLKFVKSENIFETLKIYQNLIQKIEEQTIYKSLKTKCEPMLSKYNLYTKLGGNFVPKKNSWTKTDLILWLMFLSDGTKTTNQIANYLNVKEKSILELYNSLSKKRLVEKI